METIPFPASSHGLRMLTCGRSKPFLRPLHYFPLPRSPFHRSAPSSRLHYRPIIGSFEKSCDSHHLDDDRNDHDHNHHHHHHHDHHHHSRVGGWRISCGRTSGCAVLLWLFFFSLQPARTSSRARPQRSCRTFF